MRNVITHARYLKIMNNDNFGWCICGHKKEPHKVRGIFWWKKLECRCNRATAIHIYRAYEKGEISMDIIRILANTPCGCKRYYPLDNLELLEVVSKEKGI